MLPDLPQTLKAILVDELMLQMTPEEIGDDTPLFGPEGLGLDSVDALQLVVALEKHFNLLNNSFISYAAGTSWKPRDWACLMSWACWRSRERGVILKASASS